MVVVIVFFQSETFVSLYCLWKIDFGCELSYPDLQSGI